MSPVDFYTKEERKTNGVYYTPDFLAEYLAKKTISYYGNRKISTVIDSACGNSVLLKAFANELSQKDNELPKIIGIDKDQNAIIDSTDTFKQKYLNKFTTNFVHSDGLFPTSGMSSQEGWFKLMSKLEVKKGFDIALSNPPWGADLSGYDQSLLTANFSSAKGQFDIFNLFAEAILGNLAIGGVYGFILPDSLFSHEQSGFRSLLSKTTTIHLIARLGEKIFSDVNRACVIIIGEKKPPKKNHKVDCFRLPTEYRTKILLNETTLLDAERKVSHKVYQSRFSKNENCNFDIDLRSEEQNIFDKIKENSIYIKTVVDSKRGAEISKKGEVCQCPNCSKWMPYPRTKSPKCTYCKFNFNLELVNKEKIILNHNGVGNLKLKVGEDLYRYMSTSKAWINTHKDGINYKNLNIYNGKKILVRKTGIGITASLDYDNSITNQVVYMLKLKPDFENILSLEFVLSVLNSRLMTYYLIKKYGDNEWKSHPYLTQTMVSNLPFPNIEFNCPEVFKDIMEITKLVENEVKISTMKNLSKSSDLLIERFVAKCFNLNKEDYKAVFDTLKSAQQLIPIRRLLDCDITDIFE